MLPALTTILIFFAALASPSGVEAAVGAPQICEPSVTCEVGEFLYDDDSVLITTATCTITTRDTSGTLIHNALAMNSESGWYAYEFTAPATEGLYHSQVCCTYSGDTLCIDKSFEVKESTAASSSEIATAVWGYSGRSLDSFGSLVTAIWANSSRTLSGFGTLVSDIWGNSSRTLSGTQSTNVDNLDEMKATVDETRLLVEKLVNKPIIENFIEEETPDLGKKNEETKSVASQLFVNTQFVLSQVTDLAVRKSVATDELATLIGGEGDDLADGTIFGQINWLNESWGWDVLKDAKAALTLVKNDVEAKNYKKAYTSASRLGKLVGSVADGAGEPTLFGKIRSVRELADLLDKRQSQIDKILAGWGKLSPADRRKAVALLRQSVSSVNSLPKMGSVLSYKVEDIKEEKELKNKVLSFRGVISANKLYLAKKPGTTLVNTWIEEGSMVFKSLITNPSSLVSQSVEVKYYLPPEVKEEHVLSVDDGLKVEYDSEKNQYYVSGTFTLSAGSTKTISVRVDDIWDITESEINSLKKQAEDLSRPLEKTSYFAQGVTLKSDIDVSLGKIGSLLSNGITPEAKIRAYREAELEMEGVKEKLVRLQELTTLAGSTGTLFGFVGGAQTLAVWGLIIIMVAGFIFLAIYMRTLNGSALALSSAVKPTQETKKPISKSTHTRSHAAKLMPVVVAFVLASGVSAGVSSVVTRNLVLSSLPKEETRVVLGEETVAPTPVVVPEDLPPVLSEVEGGKGGEEIVKIDTSKYGFVNMRLNSSKVAEVIYKFTQDAEVTKIGEKGEWINVVVKPQDPLEEPLEGWVNTKYIIESPVE